ncbi:MAG: hypothetical protein ACW991_10130, partial [Candidatus Hodarchaeales archaeon]
LIGVNAIFSAFTILVIWRFPPFWALITFVIGLVTFLEGYGIWKLNIIAYIVIMVALVYNFFGAIFFRNFLEINSDLHAFIYLILVILIMIYLLRVRDHF